MGPNDARSSALTLAEHLDASGTTVASYVLASHAGHLRLLNPVVDAGATRSRWDRYAPTAPFNSVLQWRDVAELRRSDPSDPSGSRRAESAEPATGTLDPTVLDTLLRLLPGQDEAPVVVGQWAGYADARYPSDAARITLPPERDCVVWSMPASGLRDLSRVPLRWWDPGFRWVVGNDIYARSVFVSGPEDLIDRLLRAPTLEAFRVHPADPVAPEDF